MAKVALVVERGLLVQSIAEAEANGPLSNRSLLYEKAAAIYNSKGPLKEITASVVYLRVKDWGLNCVTPFGKKGRAKGVALSDEQKAAMQAGRKGSRSKKFQDNPLIQDGFVKMKKKFPARFAGLIDRVEKGSMKAAVAACCLDCSDMQTTEIKFCPCNSCPLYAFRPYQPKKGETPEVSENDELQAA